MTVFCTCAFEAVHRWPNAKGRYALLRHPHRHLFQVRVERPVNHDDRDVEFLALKQATQRHCARLSSMPRARTWSCEHYARELGRLLHASRVEVSEDGENGAVWEASC